MNKIEEQILQRAVDAFEHEVGKKLRVLKTDAVMDKMVIDAVVGLGKDKFNIVVKRWAQQANFGALVFQIAELPGKGLLVADYINKKMARRLKDEDVQFLDTAGNAHLNLDDLYVNVRGNDPKAELTIKEKKKPVITIELGPDNDIRPGQRRGTGRAFTPAGMRVVFEFLKDPELVNAPYREIVDRTDVALGTVGWVINDLKAQGVVLDRGKEKRMRELRPLLQTWVETYPLKLRRKCLSGRFRAENPFWWQDPGAEILNAQWGGETAAAIMTNYLKPEVTTLYTRVDLVEIVQLGRLRKANHPEEANVEILRPFWKVDEPEEYVHPIIVYADLITTSNTRNFEVAKLIYDEFIAEHLK